VIKQRAFAGEPGHERQDGEIKLLHRIPAGLHEVQRYGPLGIPSIGLRDL
jgi:hypothetical protein